MACAVAIGLCANASAKEDIEFVQEHLPEVAMDNRYATLPLWSNATPDHRSEFEIQGALSSTSAGALKISGPLLSLGSRWRLKERWFVGGFLL